MSRGPKKKSKRSKAARSGKGGRADSTPGILSGADQGISLDGSAASLDYSHLLSGLDSKVLVLNKLYMAVRVVTARRAFVLLSREIAEVIHADDGSFANYDFSTWAELSELRKEYEPDNFDWVKTVRFDIAVPRIIRLVGYDRLPAQRVKLNRRNLFARDHNRCQYCGKHFTTSELSIDHVIPRTQDGPDTWENLVCSCVKCNSRKGGRTPDQAHMKLIKKPVKPKRNPLISMRLNNEKYESWKAFLDEAYWSVELK